MSYVADLLAIYDLLSNTHPADDAETAKLHLHLEALESELLEYGIEVATVQERQRAHSLL